MTDTAAIIFTGGLIANGLGSSLQSGDIAVVGDRISAVGKFDHPRSANVIDIAGKVIAPGFIDAHTHDDRLLIDAPDMLPKLSQGVTTVVTGNCGVSLSPMRRCQTVPPPLNLLGDADGFAYATMDSYAAAIEAARPSVNVAQLVGHSTLRVSTMADVSRTATRAEIDAMIVLLREALANGAIGFSTGLYYPTNEAADMEEVVALAREAGLAGGIYASHIRDEGDAIDAALDEAFEAAKSAGVPLVISHHKCSDPQNWGRSVQTLAKISEASRHQEIGLDAYPYTAGSTVLLPKMVDERVRIIVTWSTPHPEMAGRDLSDIARDFGCSQIEAARRLEPAGACYFKMDEGDVRRILAHPETMIGSDGLPNDDHPHPRLWGTFPRVLGHYSRDVKLMPLEQAVHKMTGLTAKTFGLAGRGVITPGNFADITVFDPKTIIDQATYEEPTRTALGIDFVMVNGCISYRNGSSCLERNGRFLYRSSTVN